VVEQALAIVDNVAPGIKPSMQKDVETGRRCELESMIGAIGHKGRDLGIPTPSTDMVYAALLPVELKARSGILTRGV
jgi:2-dehydropantoate 2-reductase